MKFAQESDRARVESAILMDEMIRRMETMMNRHQSTTGGVEKKEKAAVIIQAFLRTTVVRVKVSCIKRMLDFEISRGNSRGQCMMLLHSATRWGCYATPFRLRPWWKDCLLYTSPSPRDA